jgi:hypothetical protein
MPTLGDQFIAESPFFALGVTAGAATAPTLTGTNTGNFSYEFQYDVGSGYNGTWLTLNSSNWSGITGITAATGVRVKLRVTVTTANASNALTYIRMDTVTNSTDRQIQYPLPLDNSLTLTGLVAGSDVVIYDASIPADGSGSNVLQTFDAISGSSATYSYATGSVSVVNIGIFKAGYKPTPINGFTLGVGDVSIPVSQPLDPSYAA